MLASGFIMLKVVSHQGEHLVCLDARMSSGVDYASSSSSEFMYLSCRGLPLPDVTTPGRKPTASRKQRKTTKKDFYLQRRAFAWNKLIGLFVGGVVFGKVHGLVVPVLLS